MSDLHVSLELAELLHATLGPLAEVLEDEGHRWAPMVKRVLTEYALARNAELRAEHGDGVQPEVAHATYRAAEMVCSLTESAIREEEDFIRWTTELDGENADGARE